MCVCVACFLKKEKNIKFGGNDMIIKGKWEVMFEGEEEGTRD